jgi:Flp pilus assembly protein TadD
MSPREGLERQCGFHSFRELTTQLESDGSMELVSSNANFWSRHRTSVSERKHETSENATAGKRIAFSCGDENGVEQERRSKDSRASLLRTIQESGQQDGKAIDGAKGDKVTESDAQQPKNPRQGIQTWDELAHQQRLQFYQAGKYPEAVAEMARALTGRGTAERWNDWASVEFALNRNDEAEKGFRRSLLLEPGNPQATANLGVLLAGLVRRVEAIPLLEQSRDKVDPEQQAAVTRLLKGCQAAETAAEVTGTVQP